MAGTHIRLRKINTHKKIGLGMWNKGFRDFLKHETFEIHDYFDAVGRGFANHKIDISQKRGVRLSGGDLEVVVGALEATSGNKIFSYVNWGTSARMIYPRSKPFLMFKPGYRPSTRPGSLTVSPPWERKGSTIYLKAVAHPGIKARRFDKLIQFLMQGEMEYEGRKRVALLAKKTWRG